MLDRYRHLIWDWYGTLLDDLELTMDIVNGLLRARGLPVLDLDRYHAVFDFPVRNYYAAIGLDVSDESFRLLCAEFISEYERRRFEARLHAGAEAILDAVRASGLTQSILSAYKHETLNEIVEHFGLTSRFDRVCGLDNIYAHSKVELGRACLASLGIDPREVLMIGDTLHDYDVAEAMGASSLLVAHGHHPLDRLAERSDRVCRDLPDLAKTLGLALAIPA
jgi:phosphoglycolate phosphatase